MNSNDNNNSPHSDWDLCEDEDPVPLPLAARPSAPPADDALIFSLPLSVSEPVFSIPAPAEEPNRDKTAAVVQPKAPVSEPKSAHAAPPVVEAKAVKEEKHKAERIAAVRAEEHAKTQKLRDELDAQHKLLRVQRSLDEPVLAALDADIARLKQELSNEEVSFNSRCMDLRQFYAKQLTDLEEQISQQVIQKLEREEAAAEQQRLALERKAAAEKQRIEQERKAVSVVNKSPDRVSFDDYESMVYKGKGHCGVVLNRLHKSQNENYVKKLAAGLVLPGEVECLRQRVFRVFRLHASNQERLRCRARNPAEEAEWVHFQYAKSQFATIQNSNKCEITYVDYVVNPLLIELFEAKRRSIQELRGVAADPARLAIPASPMQPAAHNSSLRIGQVVRENFTLKEIPGKDYLVFSQSHSQCDMSVGGRVLLCKVLPGKKERLYSLPQSYGQKDWVYGPVPGDDCDSYFLNSTFNLVIGDTSQVLPQYVVHFERKDDGVRYFGGVGPHGHPTDMTVFDDDDYVPR